MRLLTCLLIVRFFVCVCPSRFIRGMVLKVVPNCLAKHHWRKITFLTSKISIYFLWNFSLVTICINFKRNDDNCNKAKKERGEMGRHLGRYICMWQNHSFNLINCKFLPLLYPNLPLIPKSLFGLVLEGPQPKWGVPHSLQVSTDKTCNVEHFLLSFLKGWRTED